MSDFGFHLAFWSLTALTVGGALAIVTSRNLVHAAIFLVASLLGVAGLYLTLSADFIAVVQILIYVGAISVLMLFAIMLTPRADRNNSETRLRYPAALVMGLLLIVTIFVALDTDWGAMRDEPLANQARIIGESLIQDYVLPFEIAAALLTAALVGAVALAREDDEDADVHRASLRREGIEEGPEPEPVSDPPARSELEQGVAR